MYPGHLVDFAKIYVKWINSMNELHKTNPPIPLAINPEVLHMPYLPVQSCLIPPLLETSPVGAACHSRLPPVSKPVCVSSPLKVASALTNFKTVTTHPSLMAERPLGKVVLPPRHNHFP